MKAESYWQQFLTSGKVEDYLSYSRTRQEKLREQKEGENPHAGCDYSDGNDLKSDAYR